MIKTLLLANKAERDKFTIPRSVQQSIPIKRIYKDGIWQVGRKHSKTWRFADINYEAASDDDRRSIFLSYGGVLNSLPTDAAAKITICNQRLNPVDFERTILMRERGDKLDCYRKEYNHILLDKMAQSNNLVQEKFITLSIAQRKIEDTRAYFRRVDGGLAKSFGRLDSGARPVSNYDRLRILHDFFRPGEEQYFTFDAAETIRRGLDFRDLICPDSLTFKAGHFEMGGKVGRVLFLKDLASFLKDDMIAELSDFSRNLMLSIDILPIPTDEAVKEIQSRILAVETDVTRWQQKQNSNNNFSAVVPYELEQMRNESKEFLDDLTARDQRMMFAVVTIVHIADTLEQLDADTETLMAIGRNHLCQFSVLRYQQEDGLNTVLPYGLRRIKALRTLTTESTAVLMPFRAQEIQDPGGLYYGINAVSKNPLICDRKRLISPHAFMLGVSGSGKSSLVNEVLYKTLAGKLNHAKLRPGKCDGIDGVEYLDKIINIDQSPIGRTPRSNPATYTGLFDDIRSLFASTQDAKLRGYNAGRFSFNIRGGRCEACSGDGLLKIEMNFLPDVYVPCEVCKGKRYNRETLEVHYKGKNIAEVLDMTVEEALAFFQNQPKIRDRLQTLMDVGLGYVKLGQPSTTLSGGEAQRIKLATELSKRSTGRTIYVLDEPTTGLHVADVARLIDILDRLTDAGNTVLVIEHNLHVIKVADHIIDLGPEGGDAGGNIVFTGTPEDCARCTESYTGKFLKKELES